MKCVLCNNQCSFCIFVEKPADTTPRLSSRTKTQNQRLDRKRKSDGRISPVVDLKKPVTSPANKKTLKTITEATPSSVVLAKGFDKTSQKHLLEKAVKHSVILPNQPQVIVKPVKALPETRIIRDIRSPDSKDSREQRREYRDRSREKVQDRDKSERPERLKTRKSKGDSRPVSPASPARSNHGAGRSSPATRTSSPAHRTSSPATRTASPAVNTRTSSPARVSPALRSSSPASRREREIRTRERVQKEEKLETKKSEEKTERTTRESLRRKGDEAAKAPPSTSSSSKSTRGSEAAAAPVSTDKGSARETRETRKQASLAASSKRCTSAEPPVNDSRRRSEPRSQTPKSVKNDTASSRTASPSGTRRTQTKTKSDSPATTSPETKPAVSKIAPEIAKCTVKDTVVKEVKPQLTKAAVAINVAAKVAVSAKAVTPQAIPATTSTPTRSTTVVSKSSTSSKPQTVSSPKPQTVSSSKPQPVSATVSKSKPSSVVTTTAATTAAGTIAAATTTSMSSSSSLSVSSLLPPSRSSKQEEDSNKMHYKKMHLLGDGFHKKEANSGTPDTFTSNSGINVNHSVTDQIAKLSSVKVEKDVSAWNNNDITSIAGTQYNGSNFNSDIKSTATESSAHWSLPSHQNPCGSLTQDNSSNNMTDKKGNFGQGSSSSSTCTPSRPKDLSTSGTSSHGSLTEMDFDRLYSRTGDDTRSSSRASIEDLKRPSSSSSSVYQRTEERKSKEGSSPLVFNKHEPIQVYRDPELLKQDEIRMRSTGVPLPPHHHSHSHTPSPATTSAYSQVHTPIPTAHPSSMPTSHHLAAAAAQHSQSLLSSLQYRPPLSTLSALSPHMAHVTHPLSSLAAQQQTAHLLQYPHLLQQSVAGNPHILSQYALHNNLQTAQLEILWQQKYPTLPVPPPWMLNQYQDELLRDVNLLALERERREREIALERDRVERERADRERVERERAERERERVDRERVERERAERERIDR